MSNDLPKDFGVYLAEIRDLNGHLRSALVDCIDPAALRVKPKAPTIALCIREGLAWRTEECARNACEALERLDLSASALLVRAVIENTALIWKLKATLDRREQLGPGPLHAALETLLLGSRSNADMPTAVNMMTQLQGLDKKFPGVLEIYQDLCEAAHPNYGGVYGAYGMTDTAQMLARFGRDTERSKKRATRYALALSATLPIFFNAFSLIADSVMAFVADLTSAGLSFDDL